MCAVHVHNVKIHIRVCFEASWTNDLIDAENICLRNREYRSREQDKSSAYASHSYTSLYKILSSYHKWCTV